MGRQTHREMCRWKLRQAAGIDIYLETYTGRQDKYFLIVCLDSATKSVKQLGENIFFLNFVQPNENTSLHKWTSFRKM